MIKLIGEGDRDAFQKLYQLFSEKVYNTAISYTHNSSDAEEVAQDVFTSVFRNASKFQGNSEVSTWIYRITVNTSLNKIKKGKRFSFLKFGEQEYDVPDFEHPGALMEQKEHSASLFKAIDKLPESQKTAFILSYIEELPRQEVADVMEVTLKSVESLLQRGKSNLRKNLENIYPNRRKSKK
ncbi:RNA polymerase sigma factor [Portibacter lacus]|uniref:RNA polymerase sigma factor n=1 Tax=Portibacter lacus TaxID=1099794 RepID=UPI001F2E84A7|nr:RNA polymerase sigma factor [Portibacter lacus]